MSRHFLVLAYISRRGFQPDIHINLTQPLLGQKANRICPESSTAIHPGPINARRCLTSVVGRELECSQHDHSQGMYLDGDRLENLVSNRSILNQEACERKREEGRTERKVRERYNYERGGRT